MKEWLCPGFIGSNVIFQLVFYFTIYRLTYDLKVLNFVFIQINFTNTFVNMACHLTALVKRSQQNISAKPYHQDIPLINDVKSIGFKKWPEFVHWRPQSEQMLGNILAATTVWWHNYTHFKHDFMNKQIILVNVIKTSPMETRLAWLVLSEGNLPVAVGFP